jgi:hypothetical protein
MILERAPPRLKLTRHDRHPFDSALAFGLELPHLVALEGDVVFPRRISAPKLEELRADHGVEDLETFLASELPSRLRVLRLKSDWLGAIPTTPFPMLEALHVFPARPTEAEAAALVASPHFPKLARLELPFSQLSAEARAILRQRWPVDE